MTTTSPRLALIDALRGCAIVAIMLLHNLEHFDLYHTPAGLPAWLAALDKVIWDTAFFLFAGKAYAIFAFLFGVTFHIQFQHRAERGEDFRPRFAWRMLLLLGFGLLNTMFYQGDILSFYAVLGLALIPVARRGSGVVVALACLLLLQPYALLQLFQSFGQAAGKLPDPASWAYFGRTTAYLTGDSIAAVWYGNLTNGKLAAVLWSWENGRMFQIPALFMLGMLAARHALFAPTELNLRRWRITLAAAFLLFVALYLVQGQLDGWAMAEAARRPLKTMVGSWLNLALMFVLLSGFVLLYRRAWFDRLMRGVQPLGRMSLTSYVAQSIVGTFIYYGFGLGLYKHTGASASLLIGIVLVIAQCAFSAWWLRRHKQGPLEALWHRATWAGSRPAAAGLNSA